MQTILVTGASGAVGRQIVSYETFLSAAFAEQAGPVADQCRDRWFCLFHPNGPRCPDIERWTSPRAVRADCGLVDARQTWKNGNTVGKYGRSPCTAAPAAASR
ncbi:hypothetical protein [Streptomyces sp. NPDC004266]|uniref:hypothetical protein n=1 Tax=Streptomyces sp. NPDC004266 TaxID=3364693 RepID=UPI0036A9B916